MLFSQHWGESNEQKSQKSLPPWNLYSLYDNSHAAALKNVPKVKLYLQNYNIQLSIVNSSTLLFSILFLMPYLALRSLLSVQITCSEQTKQTNKQTEVTVTRWKE